MMIKPLSLFLLLAISSAKQAAASGGSCACEAEELDFTIDCDDDAAMLAALTVLKTQGCATTCTSEDCEKNYYIVQAHHDFCREAQIPEDIEDGFHDYDDSCTACEIEQAFKEGAPDCPAAICDDGSGDAAYTFLLDNGCLDDCSSAECGSRYLTLLSVHDDCEHDTLERAAEDGFHDMEDACESTHFCNSANAGADQLECDDHDHGSHDDHDSGATTSSFPMTVLLLVGASAVTMIM